MSCDIIHDGMRRTDDEPEDKAAERMRQYDDARRPQVPDLEDDGGSDAVDSDESPQNQEGDAGNEDGD